MNRKHHTLEQINVEPNSPKSEWEPPEGDQFECVEIACDRIVGISRID